MLYKIIRRLYETLTLVLPSVDNSCLEKNANSKSLEHA